MAITIKRPHLTLKEKLYVPAIFAGLMTTARHLVRMLAGKTHVSMQYPEEKWDSQLPSYYRGAPALVKDEHGRERCVACQLCEFICPPRAITIKPGEIADGNKFRKVEKFPQAFDIDMIRCIYCGLCEEVCPEVGDLLCKRTMPSPVLTRAEMVHDKEKLYETRRLEDGSRSQVERQESELRAFLPPRRVVNLPRP